jgi:hypothetical protein
MLVKLDRSGVDRVVSLTRKAVEVGGPRERVSWPAELGIRLIADEPNAMP